MKKEDGIKVAKLCEKYVNAETIIRKCENPEQRIAVKKHFERMRVKKPDQTVREFLDGRLVDKLRKIAYCIPYEGYSMGSTVVVKFAKLTVYDDRTSEYAKSSNYKAQHGRVVVRLSLDEFKNMQNIGCLATYIYPNQKGKVKKCWWYAGDGKHSRFVIGKIHGYIFHGYHAVTKEEALRGGKLNLERDKAMAKQEKNAKKAIKMQYSYQDSIDAGNCIFGTKAFILRCGLDSEKKYRGSYLLKKAREKSTSSLFYIERMIRYKANVCK